MSGVDGRKGRFIARQQVKESLQTAVGFKKLRALHEATAGDTVIDLAALNDPASRLAGANPPASAFTTINLQQFKDNVIVKAGAQELVQDIDYQINGVNTIKLAVPALDNQIFEIIIDHVPRTGVTLADAQPLVVSGTLSAGSTDFNVGEPFEVGKFPNAQHGAVYVIVDGQFAYRNVGNQPDGEGDYYEVHSGAGLGTLIRFNTPDLTNDRDVSVISVGSLVNRPDGSLNALIEALQGQVDNIAEVVAADTGNSSVLGGGPSFPDLKTFGDRVLDLEQTTETRLTDLEQENALRKVGSITSTTQDLTTKNNLWFNVAADDNKITVPAGLVRLVGSMSFFNSGGSADFIDTFVRWGLAPGGDSPTAPPGINDGSIRAGATDTRVFGQGGTTKREVQTSSVNEIFVYNSSPKTYYLNPFVSLNNPANGRFQCTLTYQVLGSEDV